MRFESVGHDRQKYKDGRETLEKPGTPMGGFPGRRTDCELVRESEGGEDNRDMYECFVRRAPRDEKGRNGRKLDMIRNSTSGRRRVFSGNSVPDQTGDPHE